MDCVVVQTNRRWITMFIIDTIVRIIASPLLLSAGRHSMQVSSIGSFLQRMIILH
jgi:hypothetical protein